MSLIKDLEDIVGPEYVRDGPEIQERYSKDYGLFSGIKPNCVIYPQNAIEVQRVVQYANNHMISLTPRSSEVGFYGASLPAHGGIVMDLSRMKQVLKVDKGNKFVKVEPGVTWSQIQGALEKDGLMVCNPLLPHPSKSVLTTGMEGEPLLIPKGEYSETCLTAEIVLPNGEMYWSGTAMGKGFASGNFPDCIYPSARLFLGVQGAFGIMTWANIKAEWLPTMEKVFFVPLESIADVAEPLYRIQRRMIGRECVVLNHFNLATILSEDWAEDFPELRANLPPFTLIIALAGLHRLPEERIAYEEEALKDAISGLDLEVLSTVGGISGLGMKISTMLRKPWAGETYWKFRYKGACHEIFFHTTLNRVAEFTRAIEDVSSRHGYRADDIGLYVQPIEYGRACYCQYGFHCNPDDAKELKRVKDLYMEASEAVIGMGGLFTNPYGAWADMVYRRTATFTSIMKKVKNVLDPNNILNPGKLCFQ